MAERIHLVPKVCFFQCYYTDYIRSQTLLEGLSQQKIELVPCIVNEPSFFRYPKAIFRFLRTLKHVDLVIANFRCWEIFPLLRLITRKPIIYDAHISVWQSYCEERGKCTPGSLPGRLLFGIDKLNCMLADRILIDTYTHADYFSNTFCIPREKFLPVYISCEDSIFHPIPGENSRDDSETKLFWAGSGIPLQGLEVIVEAMKMLMHLPIHLRIAGSSPILEEMKRKASAEELNSITFLGRVPRERIVSEIAYSDICLGGHYSSLPKAQNVIAGKLFEMIAMKKPVIAGDSPAIRELFTHRRELLLCEMGSPDALADAIMELRNSPVLCQGLADASYSLYTTRLKPEKLTAELADQVQSLAQY